MQLRVLLFAALREAAGQDSIAIPMSESGTMRAEDVLCAIGEQIPSVAPLIPSCRLAVDNRYVSADATIQSTDEVALIPPTSGG